MEDTTDCPFARAWQRTVDDHSARLSDKALSVPARDPARLAEARAVDGCVQRFVNAELATDDPRQPIGRSTKFMKPPGRVFRRQLTKCDERAWHRVHDAINDALMLGYFAMWFMQETGKVPISIIADRSAEDIWRFWISRISGTELKDQFGFSDQQIEPAEEWSRQHLQAVFASLGLLPRFGKRLKLELAANIYARAGIVLRHAQSDLISAEMLAVDPYRAISAAWRFDDYSPVPARRGLSESQ
jgi:hypothetical protein